MKVEFGTEVVNLDRVEAGVEKLGVLLEHRAVKDSLHEAGRYLGRATKQSLAERLMPKHARKRTGNLMRSVWYLMKRRKAGEMVLGFKFPKGNHAHLVDRGTKERFTKSGKYRGIMPANHFRDVAMTGQISRIAPIIEQGLVKAVEDLAK